MEIKEIKRKYNNLQFILKDKLDSNYYEKLLESENYDKMKEVVIPYFENKLHIIASYIFIFKYVFPILILTIFLVFNVDYYYYSIILLPFYMYIKFRKKWKITTTIYSLEVTAINDFISKKYGINITTNFNMI